MVRYEWTQAQVKTFMLGAIPNGEEISLGADTVLWWYGSKDGDKITGSTHTDPEPFGAWYNNHSVKSGYKAVTIDRKGTFDDRIWYNPAGSSDRSYDYGSAVNNSNQPKNPGHVAHSTYLPHVIWYKMYVPNSVDSTTLIDWDDEVNTNYPNVDWTKAPHPPASQTYAPKVKPSFFNDFSSRNIAYQGRA